MTRLTLPFHVDAPSAAADGDEHAIQAKFIQKVRERFVGVRVIALANAGKRSVIAAQRLRAEGMTKGAADVILAWSGGQTGWIEFKDRSGSLSDEQKSFLGGLHTAGHRVAVCRHWDTALDLLEQWGAPRWQVAA